MARLPIPAGDNDTWGTILNDYMQQSLDADGTLVTAATNTYTTLANTNLANATRPGLVQLAGDLTTPYSAPKVVGIQGRAVASTAPTNGQVLTWNTSTTSWGPAAGGGGGSTRSVLTISSATTAGAVTGTDYVYSVSGTTTLTMPTAVGNTSLYSIKNVGTNVVTIATTSSQTIDGSTSAAMPVQNMSLDLLSNGSNWIIL